MKTLHAMLMMLFVASVFSKPFHLRRRFHSSQRSRFSSEENDSSREDRKKSESNESESSESESSEEVIRVVSSTFPPASTRSPSTAGKTTTPSPATMQDTTNCVIVTRGDGNVIITCI